jgi:hypothetical protein
VCSSDLVDVNIRGFFVASCAAAKLMQKNGDGGYLVK